VPSLASPLAPSPCPSTPPPESPSDDTMDDRRFAWGDKLRPQSEDDECRDTTRVADPSTDLGDCGGVENGDAALSDKVSEPRRSRRGDCGPKSAPCLDSPARGVLAR
jgi:hypothetical protein